MPDALTIILDWPGRELSPNAARVGHWSAKAKAVRNARHAAKMLALELGIPASCPWTKARISMAFYPPDKRRRDLLNFAASMKPHIDGLVDAGVIVDDSGLEVGAIKWAERDPEVNPMVVIVLEKIE